MPVKLVGRHAGKLRFPVTSAYGGMQTTVGMSKRVNSRDNSAHISRDPTIKVTKVQKE